MQNMLKKLGKFKACTIRTTQPLLLPRMCPPAEELKQHNSPFAHQGNG